jgi:serine/threonine protein kinase
VPGSREPVANQKQPDMPRPTRDPENVTTPAASSRQAVTIQAPSPARLALEARRSPGLRAPAGATTSSLDLLPSGSRIGQYEIIRPLGRGGMGILHLARDLRLGRLVAIKLLAAHGAGGNERFLAEARATAQCNHENIVVIHDVGEHDEHPYMVLEYIEGQTLSAWLAERMAPGSHPGRPAGEDSGEDLRPLAPSMAVELMIPVVRALACAHDMGIVHRDLKPANIMLTHTGTIKVLDFGIAKLLESGTGEQPEAALVTTPGAIVGTLPYMSPEQLAGEPVDHRTDIWAVGIMLFEMVTGTHPTMSFDAELPGALLDAADRDLPMPSAADRAPRGAELGPLATIIDRCLIKDRLHRTSSARVLLQELETIAGDRPAMALDEHGNPFAGLASFQESDGGRFFGRDRDIVALVAKLRSQPLVSVAGPSGVGKSSLVRAGVIPVLKRSGEGWDAWILRPGRRPLTSLADALAAIVHASTGEHHAAASARARKTRGAMGEALRSTPGFFGAELRTWARNKRRRLVIFVDQFEELYTQCTDPGESAAFIACLDGVADDASSPLRVIVSIRSDFLDRVAAHRSFMNELGRGLYFLPPLDRDGLREALVRPVEAADHRYEGTDMVEDMLDAVAATPGALPLLQFAASKLWTLRDRERRLLTRESYQAMGGIAGTLAGHADTVLAGMPALRLARARAILERLVTPERTRAIASLGELRSLPGDPDQIEQVVQYLVDARLLVIGGDDDDRTVEIVHESLIDTWPTLRRWLDEHRDDAVLLARLRSAAAQWDRSRRDPGLLWHGEPSREAQAWHARYQGELSSLERDYLHAVFSLASRSNRLKRALIAGLITFLSVLLLFAAVALLRISRAEGKVDEQNVIIGQQVAALRDKHGQLKAALREAGMRKRAAEAARDEAAREKQEAEAARDEARQEKLAAEAARDEAQRQRQAAERALVEAERQMRAVALARNEAERRKREAEAARDQARQQEQAASAARDQAERQKQRMQRLLERNGQQDDL